MAHRRSVAVTLLGVIALVAMGCAGANRPDFAYRAIVKHRTPVIPPVGILYTHIEAPLSTAPPPQLGTRTGRATSHQIGLPPLPIAGLMTGIDLFAWGDASEEAARREGDLTQVHHTDYELTVYLLIYRQFTVVAHGE